jgi:tight adherence protein B
MALLILVFIVILLVTFVLIVAMTRRSSGEKSVDTRIATIRNSMGNGVTLSPRALNLLLKSRKEVSFRWLEDILQNYDFAQKLQMRIMQANSSTTVSILILSGTGLFFLGYIVTWFFAPVVLVDFAAGALLCLVPFWVLSMKRSKRIASFNAVLADTIDMMGRAIRAGHSMMGAIEMVSQNAPEPAASEFGEIFKQQNLGMPLREALMLLLDRFPSLDLRVLVTAILVQRDTGGNLAEILDRTVFVIRDRLRIQGEIRVQTAQGRLTGWILSALPVVMLLLINVVNPGYSSILLSEPTGRKLVYVSLGMLITGSYLIHRIVNGIEI